MDIYIAMGIIIIVIIIDQLTKFIAQNAFKKRTKNILGKTISFSYLENSGMAMGRFSGEYYYFLIMSVVSLTVFCYLCQYIDFYETRFFSIFLSILIGGTIGNFIDRVTRGYVIDFFSFNLFKKSSPVFNIADFAILFGALGALIFGIIEI